MSADDNGGTYTWTTKAGETLSGSEDEMLAALHAGDLPSAGFDASTGLYWWHEQSQNHSADGLLVRLTSAIRRRFG